MKIKFKKGYILIISQKVLRFVAYMGGNDGKKAKGAAFFPFLFVKSEEFMVDWVLIHEQIHFRQQIETLFIGSIILGILEKLYAHFVLNKSWFDSYLWISGEQEAYLNMYDQNYLKNRKMWAQFHYLKYKKNFTLTGPGIIKYL